MAFTEDSPGQTADDALVTLCARAQSAWVARWTRSWRARHPRGAVVEVGPTAEGRAPPKTLQVQLDAPCWRLALGRRPALILAERALCAWSCARRDAALLRLAETLACGSELIFTAAEAPPTHPRLHLVERRAPLDLGALPDPPAWAPLAAPLAWLTAAELGATALWRLAVRSDGAW